MFEKRSGRIKIIFLLLPLLLYSSSLESTPLSNSIMDAIVKISGRDEKGEPVVGTGFLLEGKTRTSALLITAAHLLQSCRNGKFELTIRSKDEVSNRLSLQFNFFNKRSLTLSKNNDLVAFSLKLPSSASYKLLSPDILARDQFFKHEQMPVGSPLLIYGYPYGQDFANTGYCILRRGVAASYPNWPVKDYPFFLADFEVFPGYSGAPVFIRTPTNLMLVGMVVEEVFLEELRPQKSKTIRRRHGLGLGKVLNAALIREFISSL